MWLNEKSWCQDFSSCCHVGVLWKGRGWRRCMWVRRRINQFVFLLLFVRFFVWNSRSWREYTPRIQKRNTTAHSVVSLYNLNLQWCVFVCQKHSSKSTSSCIGCVHLIIMSRWGIVNHFFFVVCCWLLLPRLGHCRFFHHSKGASRPVVYPQTKRKVTIYLQTRALVERIL